MKKKVFLSILLALFFVVIAVAQEAPTPITGEEDYNKLKDFIDNNTPIDDQGKINLTAFELNKTGLEKRIDAIDSFLDTYGTWMIYVFGMKPEATWLFLINLSIWIFFFYILIITGKEILPFDSGRIMGALIFIALLASTLYAKMAHAIHYPFTLLPGWANILSFLLLIVLLIQLRKPFIIALEFISDATYKKGAAKRAEKNLQRLTERAIPTAA